MITLLSYSRSISDVELKKKGEREEEKKGNAPNFEKLNQLQTLLLLQRDLHASRPAELMPIPKWRVLQISTDAKGVDLVSTQNLLNRPTSSLLLSPSSTETAST